ncbi:helix-turn-helix domain-containing protein [Burkholderia multivorans]|uniref:helix-turn-helix domain-containing protein n=1 Tax=Burkholderia multivorans TaxID=87883 RepID=UPI0020B3B24A|nr:helix-turn-helix transcriptional regulator [Burkholderia multivorans]
MEKLDELLREYAQSIRRDDGTRFMHADAIRELFRARATSANDTGAEGAAELESMTRMFHAACHDLGLINEALGLDPDDGGAEPILDAIAELRAQIASAQTDEPVAWAVYNGWSRICFYMTEEDARDHAQKAQKNYDLSGLLAAFRVVPLYAAPQPSPADERAAFEKVFPMPADCQRIGSGPTAGYAPTEYGAWEAHDFIRRWEGWKARAAASPAAVTTMPNEFQRIGIRWLQDELSKYNFEPNGFEDQRRNALQALCVALLEAAPQPARAATPDAEAVNWRELSRRLYVELFHCDQQMRSTRDEDGEPHWTQSAVVRDVLADAKAALDGAPQPAQADAPAEAREPAKVDTKARMDWAAGILRKLPPLDPTYSIISILDDHDREDRDEVLHSIRVFADMRATQALFTLYRAPADSGEARLTDEPSLTNPLTPYGMLVRALRIVSGTTLMDMAKALLTTPAKLSAMEFGRAPVTPEFAFDVAAYFDALGVPCTEYALRAAARAQGGDHE